MTSRFVKFRRLSSLALLSAGVVFLTVATPATAQERHFERHFGGFHSYHGRNIRVFGPHELGMWRGGIWRNEWHNGLFGWWWFVGGEWYLYPTPVYPYPTVVSETVVVDPAAPSPPPPPGVALVPGSPGSPVPAGQTWWYCDNPGGYYPHVPVCNVPFRPVAPTPSAGQAPPSAGYPPPPGALAAPPSAPPQ